MNVLAKIVIPRTNHTIKYIMIELEELSREDFYRLKCTTRKKRKAKAKDKGKDGPTQTCPICGEVYAIQKRDDTIEEKPCSKPKVVEQKKSDKSVEIIEKLNQIPLPIPPLPDITAIAKEIPKISSLKLIKGFSDRSVGRILGTVDRTKEVELKKLLTEIQGLSQQLIENGTAINMAEFMATCEETIKKLEEVTRLPPAVKRVDSETKKRLDHLKNHLKDVINVTQEFRGDTFLSPSIENFLITCQNVDDKINLYVTQGESQVLEPETKGRLEHLKNHLKVVEKITKDYETEGILSPSVEDFLKSCEEFKSKIDNYTKTGKEEPGYIDVLKTHVSGLEELTKDIKREGFVSPSVEKFLASCKGFKTKLDESKKKDKPRMDPESLSKLKSQIDQTISLTKEAGASGIITESVLDFIKSCESVKQKLGPKSEELKEPNVIQDLRSNITDVMKSINMYREHGLVTKSVEDFLKTCEIARAKLDIYEAYPPCDDEVTEFLPVCSNNCLCADMSVTMGQPCDRCAETASDYKSLEAEEAAPCDSCSGNPPPAESFKSLCFACDEDTVKEVELVPYVDPVMSADGDECGFCKKSSTCEECSNEDKSSKPTCNLPYKPDKLDNKVDTGCKECGKIEIPSDMLPDKMGKLPCESCAKVKNPDVPPPCYDPTPQSPAKSVKIVEPREDDDTLGLFVHKVRTITRVTRTQNPDGTVNEETEVITVKQTKHDPNETEMDDCDDDDVSYEGLIDEEAPETKDEKCVAMCTFEHLNAGGFLRSLKRSKSEININRDGIGDFRKRFCVSLPTVLSTIASSSCKVDSHNSAEDCTSTEILSTTYSQHSAGGART